MKLTGDDLLKELRHHEEAYQSLIHGPLCGCAADRIEALVKALAGLLEIEDARIATGAFTPNEEAGRRIDAARALVGEAK